MCCPAVSVTSCQPTPHNALEERRSLLWLRFTILQRRVNFWQSNELGAGALQLPWRLLRDIHLLFEVMQLSVAEDCYFTFVIPVCFY